jgi:hypothetical protein
MTDPAPPGAGGRPPRGPRMSTDGVATGAPPLRQVVGFHVEGVAASPAAPGLLATDPAAGGPRASSSPNPVLIPPTFASAAVLVRKRGEKWKRGREEAAAARWAPALTPLVAPSFFFSRPPAPHRPVARSSPPAGVAGPPPLASA